MGQGTSPVNISLPAWLDRQLLNPRKIEGLGPLLTATFTSPAKQIETTNRLVHWKAHCFLRLTRENQHTFPMRFLRNPSTKSKRLFFKNLKKANFLNFVKFPKDKCILFST